jgi:hypothetical protein
MFAKARHIIALDVIVVQEKIARKSCQFLDGSKADFKKVQFVIDVDSTLLVVHRFWYIIWMGISTTAILLT